MIQPKGVVVSKTTESVHHSCKVLKRKYGNTQAFDILIRHTLERGTINDMNQISWPLTQS